MALSYVAQYTLTATTPAELTKAAADIQVNPAVSNVTVKAAQLRVTFTLTAVGLPTVSV